jgi:hypothetical protein
VAKHHLPLPSRRSVAAGEVSSASLGQRVVLAAALVCETQVLDLGARAPSVKGFKVEAQTLREPLIVALAVAVVPAALEDLRAYR